MDWRDIEGAGRVAFNQFSPKEVAALTGLSTDLQRVWRRRGHLSVCEDARATFDASELAEIAVRYELTRFGFSPPDTKNIGQSAGPIVLYFALLTDVGAADLRGGLKRIAETAQRFSQDDEMARLISGVQDVPRFLRSIGPPKLELLHDACASLSREHSPAMLLIDLALIGQRLVRDNPKPLFLIDMAG